MSRRLSLPGAEELFRSTNPAVVGDLAAGQLRDSVSDARAWHVEAAAGGQRGADEAGPGATRSAQAASSPGRVPLRRPARPGAGERRPTGRERHEEKITVYCSGQELVDLEHARLVLRGEHGLAVDRGRIVREALAVVLADLAAEGEASILVRRLRGD